MKRRGTGKPKLAKRPKLSLARTISLRGQAVRSISSQGEKKTIDLAPAGYACDTTGSVTALNLVATGTDFTDRVGRKIRMKSCYIVGKLVGQDTTVLNSFCRVMLIYDKQPTGSLPAITAFLKTSNSTDQRNLDNRDRFVVLKELKVALASIDNTATSSYAGSPTVFTVDLYTKMDHETVSSGTTANINVITTGALYLVTIGDQVANSGYVLAASTRVRFLDS